MRTLLLTVLLGFVTFTAGCNKASNADVDEGIRLWNQTWDGYFKALEDSAGEPDKLIAAGQKYIDDHQTEIKKAHKIFSMNGTQAQIDKVEAAVKEGMSKIQDRMSNMAETMAKAVMAKPGMTPEQATAEVTDLGTKIQDQAMSLVHQLAE